MSNQVWKDRYQPPQESIWKGRQDSDVKERFFENITFVDLLKVSLEQSTGQVYGFVGFASDEGVERNMGRRGAIKGPEAIRKALANFPLHQLLGASFIDVGDVMCEDDNLEEAQQALGEVVFELLSKGIFPIVFGGGHEVSWGMHQGISAAETTKSVAVINFDAHLDLRPLLKGVLGSSGTSFLQIAKSYETRGLEFEYVCIGLQQTGNTESLLEVARQHAAKMVLAEEFFMHGPEKSLEIIRTIIQKKMAIHLTICLDVFAAAFAPGVSSPQVLGLLPWHVMLGLKELARSGLVIGFDIAELSPPLDTQDMTAKLAASLVAHFLYEHFQSSHPKTQT